MDSIIEGFPLSPQQKKVWLSQQEDGFPYVSRASIRIEGELDRATLIQALRQVVRSHEILRTCYRVMPGLELPLQVITDFTELDLSEAAAVDELNLESGPVVRVSLSKEDSAIAILRVCVSALCTDAHSMRNLVVDLAKAYEAVRAGGEFASDPVQYVQFSEWQNETLTAGESEAGKQYWIRQQSTPTPEIRLPLESTPSSTARRCQVVHRLLPLDLVRRLNECAAELGVSLRSVLLSCWTVQLSRLSKESVIGVRVCLDGRPYAEMQTGLGLYERWPLLRTTISAGQSFAELVKQVDATLREAESWEEYYEEEEEEGRGGMGFEWREEEKAEEEGGLKWEVGEQESGLGGKKWKLVCEERGEEIRGEWWYEQGRVERETVEWWMEGWERTLVWGGWGKSGALKDAEVIGEGERSRLEEWSWGGAGEEGEETIADRFAVVAEEQEERIALVVGEEQWSYGAVRRWTSRLGRYLQRAGVKQEEVVGLSVERSSEQMMGLLGILKAGGAYVPLEPEWPWERRAEMARELGLRLVVTTRKRRGQWEGIGVRLVELDEERERIEAESEEEPDRKGQTGEDLAYVLYTSGSTGRARGVMVTQGGVMNLCRALRERVYGGGTAGRRVGLNASLSFDASVKQWVQWLSGAVVEVTPEEVRGDGERLREWVRERGVEVIDATPSQWQWVVRAGAVETRVLLGGEPVPEGLWRQVAEQKGNWNVYGPTECTVDASAGEIGDGSVDIGRPLEGVRIYVVDEEGGLAGAGVKGEICIGGRGLGRGYVGRGDWTAERWIPDGISGERGARLYRSGDHGRYGNDGRLEYLGREDGQVKVRGYRVELGEVEAILREHAWVREAAVAVKGGRFVGYVTLEGGGDEGRVRHRLGNGLEIVAHSRLEADELYAEIFEQRGYGRYGIEVPDEGVVIDVGANIGMFTMWVCEQSRGARVWALEPIAAVAGTLRRNVARYGERVKVRGEGLSGTEGWERFTYYRGATALSGMSRYADEKADWDVVKQVVGEVAEEGVLESQQEVGRVRTLTGVLKDEGVERVDLLKVDVQRAEWEVLEGIGEADWERIGQIVMEVHDEEEGHGRLEQVVRLLEQKGYAVAWERAERLKDRYNVYAKRGTLGKRENGEPGATQRETSAAVEEVLKEHVRRRLPEYMVPTGMVVMERMPVTRSGKLDRQSLPEPKPESGEKKEEGYRNGIEEIVGGIWSEVLGRERVGRRDNFFELGGHSLLATQVMARVRRTLGVELGLRSLFEEPTVAGLSRRVEEAGVGEAAQQRLERANGEGLRRASYGQQRLWFLQQMEPESATYNCPAAVRLKGELDEEKLEQSLKQIVRRHEVLRTRYRMTEGALKQEVGDGEEFELQQEDLRGPDKTLEQTLAQRLEEEARQAFDLGRDLPIRARLLRTGDQEWVLALTLHHIAADGWSMGVLVRELNAHYAGGELEELALQYGDYAEWEGGRNWQHDLEYWKRRLTGMVPALELPVDQGRSGARTDQGGRERVELSAALSRRVGEVSRRYGVSEYMTLLAGFQVMLWRYSGQTDIAVGTALGGREREELEELIGLFINTVVVRTELHGNERFGELLTRVREEVLEAERHGGVPFEQVVEAVQTERSLRHGPLVQVMFVYEGRPGEAEPLKLGTVECEGLEVETGTAKFDVMLGVTREGEKLIGVWEYSRPMWEAETARRMVMSWLRVIETAMAQPEQRVSELEWISETERRQVLEEWNRTERNWDNETDVVGCMERIAQQQPESVAVETEEGETIRYGELNRKANVLARKLKAEGLKREQRVGVCLERGVGMVVALLGILKAGGAYVPVEPGLPEARRRWMLEETGARLAITDTTSEPLLKDWPGRPLRVDAAENTAIDDSNLNEPIEPDQLAYVIYTSGSTGLPKGVAIPNRAIVRLVRNANYVQFSAANRIGQIASFGFDALTFEVWGALLNGARLVVLSRDTVLAPRHLMNAFLRFGIDTIFITAALFNQVAREKPTAFQTLSTVIAGGEALDPHWTRIVLEKGKPASLLNGYGPTENTTFTACHLIESVEREARSIPIGRPVSDTQVYVLDDDLQPLPVGVEGWLCTAGDGLARGYLDRSDLTAERFVPNPFSKTPGGRVYQTGDRARFRSDGVIEFLGRRDDQIKLRGHRIEVGEIQAVLQNCPDIADCIVIVREEAGERHLAAYVVGDLPLDSVRCHLKTFLPEYMVPAAIERLDRLPLTDNGKVDRQALLLSGKSVVDRTAFVPPAPGFEEVLAALWSQLLPADRISADDNFFEIGGHSLLATRLISRIHETFGTDLRVRSIFENPTISLLASVIQQSVLPASQHQLIPVVPYEKRSSLPLSFAQQRLWFLSQLEPENPTYTCSIALRLKGELNEGALEASLLGLMERHEALRTRFVGGEEGPRQVIEVEARLKLKKQDLSGLEAEEREQELARQGIEEARAGFDLEKGPLVRARLLRLGDREHALLLSLHHIVCDGWSLGVLMREWSEFYSAACEGRAARLEPLRVQYGDYAVWQREWLKGEELERQIGYWRERLGEVEPLELPTDHGRPAQASYRGGRVRVKVERELREQLEQMSRQHGVTLFMTLLGVFQVLLHRYSGQREIVVGTPVAGRQRVEVEGLIGFFVNTLALRTEVGGDPEFEQLLERVKETTLGGYSHQDIPFEQVVAELEPERSLSHSPVFQVMLVYQNAPEGELELKGLQWEELKVETGTAKYDLTLGLGRAEDGGLEGALEYNRDLFEAESVERMVERWVRLLEAVVANPGQRISELEMLSETERTRVVDEWNRTEAEIEETGDLAQQWERQVEQTPERIAVESERGAISYGELDRRANGVAQRLRRMGVGAEVRVGLCVERSEGMVAAILGVWKAGGAWVALDANYPAQRLEWMVKDASLVVVLCERATAHRLSECATTLIEMEDIEPAERGPQRMVHPDNLAYVIYTSGSTGRPKGVSICHSNVIALLAWAESIYSDSDICGVVANTSLCFDLSIFELFAPLMRGGTVLLVDHILQLPQLSAGRYATLINTVPSAIPELLRQDGIAASVRIVNLAGEPLTRELVDRIYNLGTVQKVFDLYGPSEDTTYSTYCLRIPCGPEVIGAPISNTRLYVLDARLEPVGVGIVGEMYLGGRGLGRGYEGRADLTAERWIPNPFGEEGGERLYRTGDRGRWRADGQVEYLGRLDAQVKVRGFRIELGEIEAALGNQAGVREAAAVVRDGRLVAYVAGEVKEVELRAGLGKQLPEYMVPGVIVVLEKLPRLANGKLDRRGLPEGEEKERGKRGRGPRNAVEAELVRIWSQTLGREQVGVDENFFQLGGDSILSIQIVSRVRQAGLKLSVREMFQRQTIAELAEVVEQSRQVEAEQGEVRGELELTPIQRWFFEQELEEAHHWNQAVILRWRKGTRRSWVEAAWREVVRHHDGLRQRFEKRDNGWHGWQEGAAGEAAVEWIEVSSREQLEQIAEERQRSLNLSRGPMVRAVGFDRGEDGLRLLVVAHHLVVDGVSWRILMEDLEQGCRQASVGDEVSLAAKTTSWRRWSQRLAEYGRQGDGETSHQEMEDVDPWPVEWEGGENREAGAAVVRRSVGDEATQRLLEQGKMQTTLLGALAGALTRYSGQRRVMVEVEGHGREEMFEDVDITRTVGWFTTAYPLVLEVKSGEGLGQRARRIEDQIKGMGKKAIEEGVKRRENQKGPAVGFNYLGQFESREDADRWLCWGEESSGAVHSGLAQRAFEWEINVAVREGRLWMEWIYGGQRYERASVEEAAEEFVRELEEMAWGEEEASYELTPMQQGMLFHMLWEPESGIYYEQMGLELEGDLNGDLWKQAWQGVVNRHEALRTEVHWQEREKPVQVVKRKVMVTLEEEDWSELSGPAYEQRLDEELRAERQKGFQLERAPLMRLRLIRREAKRWECIWSHPHLMMDGWAVPVVLEEVMAIYRGLKTGQKAKLPAAGRYRDYVEWQGRQETAKAEAYWREHLKGMEEAGRLPAEKRSGERAKQEYAERKLELSEEATSRLEAMARGEQVTLNTVVQGAWSVVLSRHSGNRDVVFGATVSGRPEELAGVERTVGLFLNTLPVRVKVSEQQGIGQWLRELQEQEAEARQYQYASLAQVQGWSGIAGGRPLFKSVMVFENYPVGQAEGIERETGVELKQVRSWERTHYPLTLVVGPGRRLRLRMSYQQERWDGNDLEPVLAELERVLVTMTRQPEMAVGTLEILDENERQRLVALGRGGNSGELQASVMEMFEQQVRQQPEAVALVDGEEQWSYRELNETANRIARVLMEMGVGPETRVGLLVERGTGMVAALLGVLKAGGAYVPLEPGLPEARLGYMIEDAAIRVVIREPALRHRIAAAPVTILELDDPQIAMQSSLNPASRIDSDNLAYLIYTSGSTGLPKAVLISHANLASRTAAMIERYGIDSSHRMLQFISLGFDASAEEIYPTLTAGGSLIVHPDPSGVSVFSLLDSCEQMGATTLHLPAAYWSRIVRELHFAGEALPAWLRLCIVGGEAPDPAAISMWCDMNRTSVRLFNAYGPTETTVTASACELTNKCAEFHSIGRPLSGVNMYVLDGRLQPVPMCITGELFIGGSGVALGYANRADLTAHQFIPDPFSQRPGSRLYRTGDLARFSETGGIEFLGRADRQIKVRGFRIELDEIESVLKTHLEVSDAAVVLRSRRGLIAYVSVESGSSSSTVDVTKFLKTRLPSHMIPDAVERLDALPRTAAGKVDYRALPDSVVNSIRTPGISLNEPCIEILLGMCKELSNNKLVTAEDNFFEMGGNSLLVIQLASRIRTVFAADVPLRAIFDAPSLRDLARTIEENRAGTTGSLRDIRPVSRDAALPLSFAQESLWRVHTALSDSSLNHVVQVLRFHGLLNTEALERALLQLVSRHEVLRTTFIEEHDELRQQIAPPEGLELAMWDLRRVQAGERSRQAELVAIRETSEPFDLARGPLFRAALLRVDEDEHLLVLSMHHIIADGWSVQKMTAEITECYRAYSSGASPQLSELPVQYADFADWERTCLDRGLFENDLNYWRHRLAGAEFDLQFGASPENAFEPAFHLQQESVRISPETSRRITQYAQAEHSTTFILLCAAWKMLLRDYSPTGMISCCTLAANRTMRETEDLIGLFLNTVILRTDLSGNISFREAARRVRDTAIGAYAHQSLPFEVLLRTLEGENRIQRASLSRTLLVFENIEGPSLNAEDMSVMPVVLSSRAAGEAAQPTTFDLVLVGAQDGDEIELALRYRPDLFTPAVIRGQLKDLVALLESGT